MDCWGGAFKGMWSVFCRHVVKHIEIICSMFVEEYGGISYLCVLLRTPQYAWRMLLRRGCCSGKEEYLKLTVVDLHALGSTVYHIWRNRNALKYEDQLIQKIKWDWEVWVHLMCKGKFRMTKGHVDICYGWGIYPNMLV